MEDRQRLSFVFSQTMNDVIDAQMHKFPPCDKGNPDAQLKAVKFPSQDQARMQRGGYGGCNPP